MMSRTILFSFAFLTLAAFAPTSEAKVRRITVTSLVVTLPNTVNQTVEAVFHLNRVQVINNVLMGLGTMDLKIFGATRHLVGTVTGLSVQLPIQRLSGSCNTLSIVLGAPLAALTATFDGGRVRIPIVISVVVAEISAVADTAICIVSSILYDLLAVVAPILELILGVIGGLVGGLLGGIPTPVITTTQLASLREAATLVNALLSK